MLHTPPFSVISYLLVIAVLQMRAEALKSFVAGCVHQRLATSLHKRWAAQYLVSTNPGPVGCKHMLRKEASLY